MNDKKVKSKAKSISIDVSEIKIWLELIDKAFNPKVIFNENKNVMLEAAYNERSHILAILYNKIRDTSQICD